MLSATLTSEVTASSDNLARAGLAGPGWARKGAETRGDATLMSASSGRATSDTFAESTTTASARSTGGRVVPRSTIADIGSTAVTTTARGVDATASGAIVEHHCVASVLHDTGCDVTCSAVAAGDDGSAVLAPAAALGCAISLTLAGNANGCAASALFDGVIGEALKRSIFAKGSKAAVTPTSAGPGCPVKPLSDASDGDDGIAPPAHAPSVANTTPNDGEVLGTAASSACSVATGGTPGVIRVAVITWRAPALRGLPCPARVRRGGQQPRIVRLRMRFAGRARPTPDALRLA